MLKKILKKPNNGWIIWLGIFLSYIIVGFGVYLWQSSSAKECQQKQAASIKQLTEESAALHESAQKQIERIQNNEIDLASAKVGDRLANGMIVKEILGNQGMLFKGAVVISGSFDYSLTDPEDNFGGRAAICMRPDSSSLLPHINSNVPVSEFCFSNQDVAKGRYSPVGSSGKAIVVIDNFELIPERVPLAELIKTIEITK